MEEFFTNLHIGWWFLAQTLIIMVCFISLDNYAYKRTMLFANAIEDLKAKVDRLSDKVGDVRSDLMNEIVSIPECNAPERDEIGEDY